MRNTPRRARDGITRLLVACALLVPASAIAEPDAGLVEARTAVESLYVVLSDCMQNAEALGLEGRREKLEPAIAESYDIPLMAAKVLGRHWRKLSDEDKTRWVTTFGRLTVATFAERFDGWEGEELVVDDAEAGARNTIVVHTRITRPKDEAVPIHYRLREREGRWRVMDVFLNGTVSELALRRSEYGSVAENEGIGPLIDQLEAKIAAGNAGADVAAELE